MSKSTRSRPSDKSDSPSEKPDKPYKDFPLFPHATKRWAKKIKGNLHYFGPWADWQAALKKYDEQKDDLHAGRLPRVQAEGFTVGLLLDKFLNTKKHLVDTGEITGRTFADYYATSSRIADAFGVSRLVSDLRPDDFENLRKKLSKTWGPVSLGNEIQRIRVVFKYAYDSDLIPAPIRYGQGFKRPTKKVLRKERNKNGVKMFEAEEICAMVNGALVVGDDGPELIEAGIQLKAMILLGINCGFGNGDVALLPVKALDLDKGWVNYPRPKTGINRRCPLWPETIQAIRDAMVKRPKPKNAEHDGLIFITKYGDSWHKEVTIQPVVDGYDKSKKRLPVVDNPVSKECKKLLNELHINGRKRLGFYALRHTFETIGGDSRDQVAVDYIMGHARDDMASVYRERIEDARLQAVTEHVRKWVFGTEGKK